MYDYKNNGLLIHFLGIKNKEWITQVMNDHFPYRKQDENTWTYLLRNKFLRDRYPDYNKPIKIAVCSINVGVKFKEHMKFGIESKIKYCKKHGYDFIDDDDIYYEKGQDRSIAWSKILVVKKYLPYYDYVVWMDADTLIMNDEIKLEDFIKEHLTEREFLFTRDVSKKINTGVFFVKYSHISFKFLDMIFAKDEYINSEPYEQEQEALNVICDNNIEDFNEYSVILDTSKQTLFNCPVGLYKKDVFLIHFYGPRSMEWVSKGMNDFCPWQKESETKDEYTHRKAWIDNYNK